MSSGTRYRQGDIVLMPFPYSDLTASKQRPALILSNEKLKGENHICCLITSVHAEKTIELKKEDCINGLLPFQSFVKPERMFTIDERIIRKKLCGIKKAVQKRIVQRIVDLLE